MTWNSSHEQLRDKLVELYGTDQQTAINVAKSAGLEPGNINLLNAGTARNLWQAIVEYAIKQERVSALIEVVQKEFPGRRDLDLIKREHGDQETRDVLLWQLDQILTGCRVSDIDLERYWRASFPDRVSARLESAGLDRVTLLGELFQRTHKSPFDQRGVPALVFAHIVDDRCGGYTGLLEWADTLQQRLQLQPDEDEFLDLVDDVLDFLDNPQSSEEISLLVEVDEDGANRLKGQTYWSDGAGGSGGIFSCKLHELTAKIQEQIDDNRLFIGQRKLVIEVFLPLDLIDIDLEFSAQKGESLVVKHIVVRRILERNRHFSRMTAAAQLQSAGLSAWKRRWRRFHRPNRKIRDYHYWIRPSDIQDLNSFSARLLDRAKICCTMPEISPGDALQPLIIQHIKAGVPVVLWSDAVSENIRDIFDTHLDDETSDLLRQVRELQALSLYEPEKSIRDLHIIYDDPERPLPRRQ